MAQWPKAHTLELLPVLKSQLHCCLVIYGPWGKSLNCSVPQFPHLSRMGIILTVHGTSQIELATVIIAHPQQWNGDRELRDASRTSTWHPTNHPPIKRREILR